MDTLNQNFQTIRDRKCYVDHRVTVSHLALHRESLKRYSEKSTNRTKSRVIRVPDPYELFSKYLS